MRGRIERPVCADEGSVFGLLWLCYSSVAALSTRLYFHPDALIGQNKGTGRYKPAEETLICVFVFNSITLSLCSRHK